MPREPERATLDAYEADAERFTTEPDTVLPQAVLAGIDRFVERLAPRLDLIAVRD